MTTPANNRAHIRQFVMHFFNDQELNFLCFDYFPFVYNEFTDGMTKGRKVLLLIEGCENRGKMPDLLAALQRERPQPYDDHFTQETATPPPEPKPITRNPRQIFISHAHQDAGFARRLANDLRKRGWEIWMAPDSIEPGEKWVEAINRGLAESGVFVLVLTEAAVASRWVQSETNVAIGMEHRGVLQFIPVVQKAVSAPPMWQAYQRITFQDGYGSGLNRLLNRLGNKNTSSIQERRALDGSATPLPEPAKKTDKTQEKASVPADLQKEDSAKIDESQADSFVHPITGKEMVRIPAGEFLYGNDKKAVDLEEFWIDKTPVTNAEYKRFLDANPDHEVPQALWGMLGRMIGQGKYEWNEQSRSFPDGKAEHPVVLVSWHDAKAYAEWAGAELPTEHQWEKAARGTDGRKYPWGNEWRENHCNTKEAGIGATTPVGQFSPQGDSPYGCIDMAGNVWECTDSTRLAGLERIRRGGSWDEDHRRAQITYRGSYDNPVGRFNNYGFRVVVRRPTISS